MLLPCAKNLAEGISDTSYTFWFVIRGEIVGQMYIFQILLNHDSIRIELRKLYPSNIALVVLLILTIGWLTLFPVPMIFLPRVSSLSQASKSRSTLN